MQLFASLLALLSIELIFAAHEGTVIGQITPPSTLNNWPMTAVPTDTRPLFTFYSDVEGLDASDPITFNPHVRHRAIWNGWAGAWSHNYTGSIYSAYGAQTLEIFLPQDTCAFIFYTEPNPYDAVSFTIQYESGDIISQKVDAFTAPRIGAFGFGVTFDIEYGKPSSIKITVPAQVSGVVVGEFYMAQCGPDTDGDSIPDLVDNCPGDMNMDQLDDDNDGFGNICDTCDGKNINWHLLEHGTATETELETPEFTFNMDVSNALEFTFDILLEYLGESSDPHLDHFGLGTTYVIDFQPFETYTNSFYEQIGTCQNRNSADFTGGYDTFWSFDNDPNGGVNVGSTSFLAYPPAQTPYWSLNKVSLGASECNFELNYNGIFSWTEMTACAAHGKHLITVQDDADKIILSGTLYVSVVSPYEGDIDTSYYRVYPLIQEDFKVQILKQSNALSSAGVKLFNTSIISLSEDENDGSFYMDVLVQSADYVRLKNDGLAIVTHDTFNNLILTETTSEDCLSTTQSTCGQIFTIQIPESEISCDSDTNNVDLSGVFALFINTECRDETVCNTDSATIVLDIESHFMDMSCDAAIYDFEVEGVIEFYDDNEFSIQHNNINPYVIGPDTIYVKTTINIPVNVTDSLSIIDVAIDNVFVCTSADSLSVIQANEGGNNPGGCFSSGIIDNDGPYDIILGGVSVGYESQINDIFVENNIATFSFSAFNIGREEMYVHVQCLLTLQNGVKLRRLITTNQQLHSQQTMIDSNQIRHFIGNTQVMDNDEDSDVETRKETGLEYVITGASSIVVFFIIFLVIWQYKPKQNEKNEVQELFDPNEVSIEVELGDLILPQCQSREVSFSNPPESLIR